MKKKKNKLANSLTSLKVARFVGNGMVRSRESPLIQSNQFSYCLFLLCCGLLTVQEVWTILRSSNYIIWGSLLGHTEDI